MRRKINPYLAFIAALCIFTGCSQGESVEVGQIDAFENFLADNDMEYVKQDGIFRRTLSAEEIKREIRHDSIFVLGPQQPEENEEQGVTASLFTKSDAVISMGDSVYFDYVLYRFSESSKGSVEGEYSEPYVPPGCDKLYYTNIDVKKPLNVDTDFWPTESDKIKLGSTPLVRAVETGLRGCREGDWVHIFTPSRFGFGSDIKGIVPADTPLVWVLRIKKVIEQ